MNGRKRFENDACIRESHFCWLAVRIETRFGSRRQWKGLAEGDKPVSPKSDQHQFSSHNVNTLLKEKVMRFKKMIFSGKML